MIVHHTEPATVQSPEGIAPSGGGGVGPALLSTTGLHGGRCCVTWINTHSRR